MLGLAISKQTQGAGFVRQLFLIPKVKSAFEKAIALNPSHAAAHQSLGRYYQEVPSIYGGDKDNAWKEAEILARLDEVRGRIFNAWLWEKNEKFADAEKELVDLLKTHESDWRIWNAFGTFLMRMNRYGEALPRIQQYCAMRRDTSDSHARLGEVLLRLGEKERALQSLKTALEIDPYSSSTYLLLAEAHEQVGNKSQAVEIYRKLALGKLKQDQRKLVERKLKEIQ